MKPRQSRALLILGLIGWSALLFAGCVTSDDARILQLLNERGFGRKYMGNANEVFYFGIGDYIQFVDEQNPELRGQARIRMDGTVDFPQLGTTYVAGLTAQEISSMLNQRLGHYFKYVDVSVAPGPVVSKKIFIQLDTDRHLIRKFEGDQTLFDVVQSVNYDSIVVDLDNVKLIRPDPVHPLVIYCDIDSMMFDGNSRDNILVKEDDIIYFTPTLIGYLTRFVKILVTPLKPIVQLFTGVRQLEHTIDTFGEDYGYYGGRYRRNY